MEVISKKECVETIDIIIARPINGKLKIYKQGKGPKTGYVVKSAPENEDVDFDCEGTRDGVLVSKAATAYSGTPYKLKTLRYMT